MCVYTCVSRVEGPAVEGKETLLSALGAPLLLAFLPAGISTGQGYKSCHQVLVFLGSRAAGRERDAVAKIATETCCLINCEPLKGFLKLRSISFKLC